MSEQDDLEELENIREKGVVYTIPGMQAVSIKKDIIYKTVEDMELKLDIYYPVERAKGMRLPAVILIHGDGPTEFLKGIKDSGQYTSYGELIAAMGLIAVTANHRSTEGLTNVAGVANDVDDLITYVREHSKTLHIDEDNLGIWVYSAGGPYALRAALHEAPLYIRGIVCYYSITELKAMYNIVYNEVEDKGERPVFTEEDLDEFSGTHLLQRRTGDVPPMFIARAGLDLSELNDALDRFVAEAIAQNVEIDFMNHPTGQHAFDILDDEPRSHEIIKKTLEFWQAHLR